MSIAELVAQMRQQLTAQGTSFEVVDAEVRGSRMPVFRHRLRSAQALLKGSARFGDRTYVVDGDIRIDFETHRAMVDAFAAHLQDEYGAKSGPRIAIYAANRWEWVVAYWAILSAGAIPVPFNGWWTTEELRHAVGLVEPVLVIADDRRAGLLVEAGAQVPVLELASLGRIVSVHAGERPDPPTAAEDDPAELIFTSGTTGRAKAVVVPHRALVGFTQMNLLNEALALVAAGAPVPLAGEQLPPSDEIVLVTSPLFHVSMLHGIVLQAVANGSALVLLPGRFDPDRVLATIEREQVTRWIALGSAAPRLAASPALGTYDTSSVRQLGIGGAPVSPAVQQRLREAFPSAKDSLGMGYTSTEAGAVIAGIGGVEYLAHPTSTGRPTVTSSVQLRDPEGRPVASGAFGEVHVRSPYLMLGYWKDPGATAAALKRGGWLAMGDIARIDEGLLYIDSRARDMILVSAENVSPTEVEHRLEAHADVLEAAVIAVDDDVTGDAVCAFVVIEPHSAITAEDLATWCRRDLAHFKVPTRWHLRYEPLPRTASGKLVKGVLRASVEQRTP